MSVFVDHVVGQFQFVEGQCSVHPMLSGGRRVRVNMDLSANDWLVGLTSDHPPVVLEFVSIAVDCDYVDHDHIVDIRIKTRYFELQCWKHSPNNITSYRTVYATDGGGHCKLGVNSELVQREPIKGAWGEAPMEYRVRDPRRWVRAI